VILPNSIYSIGNYAFDGCSQLADSLNLPNSIISIGEGAFESCGKLKYLVIPNSVSSIGENAFWGCKSLKSIICYVQNPIDLSISGHTIFMDLDKASCTLLVPPASIIAYKSAFGWCDFKNIVGINP
jgi:hypothetical protein